MIAVAVLLQNSNGRAWPVEIGFFSPIFILIIGISLYLFLADVLVTTQLNITRIYNDNPAKYDPGSGGHPAKPAWMWYRPMIRLIALVFVFLFFFNSINTHRIRKNMVQPERAYT